MRNTKMRSSSSCGIKGEWDKLKERESERKEKERERGRKTEK